MDNERHCLEASDDTRTLRPEVLSFLEMVENSPYSLLVIEKPFLLDGNKILGLKYRHDAEISTNTVIAAIVEGAYASICYSFNRFTAESQIQLQQQLDLQLI